MSQFLLDFLPPTNWQDFERLTLSACRLEWDDEYIRSIGRPGQAQDGLDIIGWDRTKDSDWRVGVQCKRKSTAASDGEITAGGLITISEIDSEVKKTVAHSPKIDKFILATTATPDAVLQQKVDMLDKARRDAGECGVAIWFWDWFQERLNRHSELTFNYYSDVLISHKAYDTDKHVAIALKSGFDRSVMRTPMHGETGIPSVSSGMMRLQQLLATGKLKDAEGELITSSPSPRKMSDAKDRASIKKAEDLIQAFRDKFALLISQGIIEEQFGTLNIRDSSLVNPLNAMRADILKAINAILKRHGIVPIESDLLRK